MSGECLEHWQNICVKEIYKNLWVGKADEIPKAKEKGFAVVSAFKEGEHGHRSLLKYEGRSAPEGKEYYFAERSKHLYLNLVDADSADYIPDAVIDKALAFISQNLRLEHSILIACNQAVSRAPSIALIWLVKNGKLPTEGAVRKFKQLYPDYDPSPGIKIYTKQRIAARR